jgi:UDP-2,3-diacylglucosamine pyrophosphatase LpxH
VITTVREERMLVVSDVHLGNPLFESRRPFVEFLRYAYDRGYAVCINGDGVDILQSSVTRLARDLAGCSREFGRFAKRGLPIYYTVGNHDIALEQFLDDWGVVRVAPFLNILSGDRRIRLEHGHIYDEMYVQYPRTYAVMTFLGAALLRISPRAFKSFEFVNTWLIALGEWRHSGKATSDAAMLARKIPGEEPTFMRAAIEISNRGFDAVIFGHTHRAGALEMPNGSWYYNTGLWESNPYYVAIDHGAVALHPVSDVVRARLEARGWRFSFSARA